VSTFDEACMSGEDFAKMNDFDPNEQRGAPPDVPFDSEMMDLAALEGLDLPPREWAWNGWIPHGRAVYLTGAGAAGKSLFLQQFGTAYVLGREMFGYATRQGPVMGIWGEDDEAEIWRRQNAINRRLGCTMTELAAAGLC
jgi:hypothetical protein